MPTPTWDADYIRWQANRDRKTEPRVTGPYWCRKCDRWLVREGEKCPGCGFRRKTKHRKP